MNTLISFVVLFAVLSVGAAFSFGSLNEEQCADPNQVNSALCNLIPPACLRPVCAEDNSPESDKDEGEVWFKSLCHLITYNIRCRGKYRIISESDCPVETAPLPVSGTCPIQLPPSLLPFNL